MSISRWRRRLWRASSALGDAQAVAGGPSAVARRLARKQVYKAAGKTGRRISRGLGL